MWIHDEFNASSDLVMKEKFLCNDMMNRLALDEI